MKQKIKEDPRRAIDWVFPDVPKISQCDEVKAAAYKAVDEYGNVYLIRSPRDWKSAPAHSGTESTIRRYFRPKPELKYTFEQAYEEKINGNASTNRASKKQDTEEWSGLF